MQGTGAYLRHALMEGENVSDQISGPKHLMFKYSQKWVTTHLGPTYTWRYRNIGFGVIQRCS